MIRANLTSIVALARPMRMVPVEEFDLMVAEIEELRRRDRERVDLAYEERAAVFEYLSELAVNSDTVEMERVLFEAARDIHDGEHRREGER
jgi:hypothetical protein